MSDHYGSHTVDAVSCSLLALHERDSTARVGAGIAACAGVATWCEQQHKRTSHLPHSTDLLLDTCANADVTIHLSVAAEPSEIGRMAVACSDANHPCHM